MPRTSAKTGAWCNWHTEFRTGFCEKCQAEMVGEGDERHCSQCGHDKGQLICGLRKRSRWFLYFLGNWDAKRVAYCGTHRDEPLHIDFRWGRLSWGSFVQTIKLRGKWDVQVPEVQ